MSSEERILDVRPVAPRDRFETIMGAYNRLDAGQELELIVDHDPKCMYYTLLADYGAEAFGFAGPDIDAELIVLSARLLKRVGVTDLTLQLNSLGTAAARAGYRDALHQYFSARVDAAHPRQQASVGAAAARRSACAPGPSR